MYQSREELLTPEELKEAQDIVRTSQLRIRRTPCILVADTAQELAVKDQRLDLQLFILLKTDLIIIIIFDALPSSRWVLSTLPLQAAF